MDARNPQGWIPPQKLAIVEAIGGYTMGSAYVEFQERDKGWIAVGKLAGFLLLSDLAPVDIRRVKIEMTWVGGLEIYDASKGGK